MLLSDDLTLSSELYIWKFYRNVISLKSVCCNCRA